MDSQGVFCPNLDCPARGQRNQGTIRVHSQKDQRYRCTVCHKTFAATKGTPFYRLHAQREVFVSVVTLLAFGCPPAAIVAAFSLDERTIRAWQAAAGSHSEQVHQQLVLQPHDLGQVQADELRVKKQGGIVWLAMALAIPTRLWLGGVVSAHRDGKLAAAIVALVYRCAAMGPLLWCVDGWKPYVPAICRAFRTPMRTGGRGRPMLQRWPGLSLAQVVKQHARRHVIGILRRVVVGTEEQVQGMLVQTQGGGVINTAWIERLNGTFRSRITPLVRRGRALARQEATLHQRTYLTGTVYNFCTPHGTLSQRSRRPCTPAMAAELTDHCWTVGELLAYPVAPPRWVPPKSRGRRSLEMQKLVARWCA